MWFPHRHTLTMISLWYFSLIFIKLDDPYFDELEAFIFNGHVDCQHISTSYHYRKHIFLAHAMLLHCHGRGYRYFERVGQKSTFPIQSVCALKYINIGCTSIRSSGSQRLGMTSPSHLHSWQSSREIYFWMYNSLSPRLEWRWRRLILACRIDLFHIYRPYFWDCHGIQTACYLDANSVTNTVTVPIFTYMCMAELNYITHVQWSNASTQPLN